MAFSAGRLLSECKNRAIVYCSNGDPSQVLRVMRYGSLLPPTPETINVRFVLSPINPADVNVIEGVYPSKPTRDVLLSATENKPVFIGGNEGLAKVTAVGDGVQGLKKGDWVVMTRPQMGTWCTAKNVGVNEVVKMPKVKGVSEVNGATVSVNPPTAYNMLHDFVQLQAGDWVVQNGANSAVGQAVIQIASAKGIKTLNFIRPRDNFQELADYLCNLGATKVLTYDALSDRSLSGSVKEWISGKSIKLGLNCVGGKETTLMAKLLGSNAHLVSYGAMSKQPLSLPTSLFIFKDLTSRGFWQTRWYDQRSREEREQLMETLVDLMVKGRLKEPLHEIITISADISDENATEKVRDVFRKLMGGHHGKKVLLKFEEQSE